jgi:hypothetical protein
MTTSQVSAILTELDDQFSTSGTLYGPGIWLEAREISAIILESNESLYPDETMQIKFDSTNSLLLTRIGRYVEGSFVASRNTAAIDYKNIMGISLVKGSTMKSPYKVGRTA